MEADKTVTAALEISMLSTIPISETVAMPDCNYAVLAEDINGPPLRYARIGDKVLLLALLVRAMMILVWSA